MIYNVLSYVFAALAVLSFAAGWLRRSQRMMFWWAGAAAAVAAIAATSGVFWTTVLVGLMVPWALFATMPVLNQSVNYGIK